MLFDKPTPILRSFDEAKTKEFYIDFLEFKIEWEHRFEENTPLYMQISKGDCILHISEHHGDSSPGATLRINVSDLDAFQKQLSEKNYQYSRPGIQDQSWGTRDMTIADPFGNKLIFTEETNVQ
ncbi:MAG: glyoxalase superfamily protein [Enterobacterales bacterium]|nr:glyoxalase superfamily protein [Enterobacterales bacterium]